jgi:hypothetical protein
MLPLLGGSPTVWVVSLAFFQTALLAGYAYAHLTARWLAPRWQALLHLALMLAAGLTLPITFPTIPIAPGDNPRLWLVMALLRSVGPAFVVIAGTAPMAQRWFATSRRSGARDPYFLYAASNAGSFVALLAFPFVLEPLIRLSDQERLWSLGFMVLGALILGCATLAIRHAARDPMPFAGTPATIVFWRDRFRWLALSALPSSLLLGVTTYISTDVAAVPLLWVVPLALYLLTFVVAFGVRPPIKAALWAQIILIAVVGTIGLWSSEVPWLVLVVINLAAFTATALTCHGMLAASRPTPAHLTEFYLWVALGGALGGWFNALLSPMIFDTAAEYPLALVLVCLLWPGAWPSWTRRSGALLDIILPILLFLFLADPIGLYVPWLRDQSTWLKLAGAALVAAGVCLTMRRPLRLALAVMVLLAVSSVIPDLKDALHRERNFFGILKVTDESLTDDGARFHVLYNGSTVHGAQSLTPKWRLQPITYYHPLGPLGRLFTRLSVTGRTQTVAVVGLGTGSIACYGHDGEDWTYFEINPAVERIARTRRWFTFLSDCPAHPRMVTGDARLMLGQQPDQRYNLIILDAFSSDAIPVHLLTREAMALYAQKLAPGGLLVFHISNRYLTLGPVIAATAQTVGLTARLANDGDETALGFGDQKWASEWMAVARSGVDLAALGDEDLWKPVEPARRPWTDDYSNILTVIDW